MGGGAAPPLPGFDWYDAPASHRFAFKALQRANWLQAVEGEIDPAHLSYLHRYLDDDAEGDGTYGFKQFLAAADDSDVAVTTILREVPNPRLEIARTDFGVRIFALRDWRDFTYARVTNYLFPHTAVVAIGDWTLVQIHVPIDDVSNWRYDIFYDFRQPIDGEALRAEKLKTYEVPGYAPRRNMENRYGFSAERAADRHLCRRRLRLQYPRHDDPGRAGADPGPQPGKPRLHRHGHHSRAKNADGGA